MFVFVQTNSKRFLAAVFCLLCAMAASALSQAGGDHAQINGTIKGIVIARESRMPLPGANVRILGSPHGAAAGKDGRFVITRVPLGAYTLEASVIGYEKQRIQNVTTTDNSAVEVKFELAEAPVPLQDVIVTPGHFEIMREEPVAQQTLTREDIKSIPQFGEDVYRAIRRLPGVSGNDFSARFTVRGGEHNEVLVLLDGLELYEPFHIKDVSGGAISIVDVQAIGGINLMTGGFPAEFGDKLSGVFDINSAEVRPERRATSLGLSFTNARFMTEGAFANGKGQWLASVRRGYLDLVMEFVDPSSTFRPKYYDVLGKWQYQFNPKHTLALNVLHAGDDLDFEEDGDVVNTGYGNSYVWFNLKSILSSRAYAQTVLSAGRVSQNREGTDRLGNSDEVRAFASDLRHFNAYGLKQDWSYDLADRHFLKFGFDLKHLASQYDYFSRERLLVQRDPNTGSFVYDTTAAALQPAGDEIGLYLADRVRVLEPLTVELGLRYDFASHTRDKLLSPRLNLAYALGQRTVLRAGWGRFYQTQGIHELQAQDGDTSFYPAELAEHRVLGVEHQFENGLHVRVEGYQKRLSHLRPRYHNLSGNLQFFPEVEEDRIRLEPERGEARGFELFVKRDVGGRLSWWGSYALASVKDEIAGEMIPRNIDQRHTVYFDLTFRPSAKWRVNLAWQYHSGWPYTETAFERIELEEGGVYYRPVYGPLNAARYPAFHSMDLKINRYFQAGSGRVALFLEFINLYNRKNVRNYYYDIIFPTNGAPQITKAADFWFPRLPSIGVSWEF